MKSLITNLIFICCCTVCALHGQTTELSFGTNLVYNVKISRSGTSKANIVTSFPTEPIFEYNARVQFKSGWYSSVGFQRNQIFLLAESQSIRNFTFLVDEGSSFPLLIGKELKSRKYAMLRYYFSAGAVVNRYTCNSARPSVADSLTLGSPNLPVTIIYFDKSTINRVTTTFSPQLRLDATIKPLAWLGLNLGIAWTQGIKLMGRGNWFIRSTDDQLLETGTMTTRGSYVFAFIGARIILP